MYFSNVLLSPFEKKVTLHLFIWIPITKEYSMQISVEIGKIVLEKEICLSFEQTWINFTHNCDLMP